MVVGIAKKSFSNLHSSEVYRELERRAVKKGFFDPKPEEIVRAASVEAQRVRKLDLRPSEDLFVDIAKLASALRSKGLENNAAEIEQNLIMYKQAESALYGLKTDSPDDLSHFAHRDGDVDIVDAGDLGMVETVQSAAAKILSVVKTEPKKDKVASAAATILRMAAAKSTITMPDKNIVGDPGVVDLDEDPSWKPLVAKNITPINEEAEKLSSILEGNPFSFTGEGGGLLDIKTEDGIAVYSQMAAVPVNSIIAYNKAAAAIGNLTGVAGAIDAKYLYGKIYNQNYNSINASLQNIASLVGVDSSSALDGNNQMSIYESTSFGSWVATDTQQLNLFCNNISKAIKRMSNLCWGDNNSKWKAQNKRIEAVYAPLIKAASAGVDVNTKKADMGAALIAYKASVDAIGAQNNQYSKWMQKLNPDAYKQLTDWYANVTKFINDAIAALKLADTQVFTPSYDLSGTLSKFDSVKEKADKQGVDTSGLDQAKLLISRFNNATAGNRPLSQIRALLKQLGGSVSKLQTAEQINQAGIAFSKVDPSNYVKLKEEEATVGGVPFSKLPKG